MPETCIAVIFYLVFICTCQICFKSMIDEWVTITRQNEKERDPMKKIIAVIFGLTLMGVMAITLTGCGNKDMFDTVYTYDRAIIALPDGEVVDGEVQNWKDYADGDQIQVKINDVVYLVHAENVVLMNE